jgi:predicted nucleic acid-binding protein
MNFLLDTSVISEPMKPRPNAGLLAWLAEAEEDTVLLSVVTITELRYGIDRLAAGRRRDRLDGWLRKDLTSRFGVDFEIADTCGRLVPEASPWAARWSHGTHSSLPPRKSKD